MRTKDDARRRSRAGRNDEPARCAEVQTDPLQRHRPRDGATVHSELSFVRVEQTLDASEQVGKLEQRRLRAQRLLVRTRRIARPRLARRNIAEHARLRSQSRPFPIVW